MNHSRQEGSDVAGEALQVCGTFLMVVRWVKNVWRLFGRGLLFLSVICLVVFFFCLYRFAMMFFCNEV